MVRTRDEVVRRELRINPGQRFDRGRLDDGVRRLKNLGAFSNAEAVALEGPDGVDVRVTLDERWTLVPSVEFVTGGGTSFLSLGALDVNAFGRALEVGAGVELYGSKLGASFHFEDGRFAQLRTDDRLALGLGGGIGRRVRQLWTRSGEPEGAFFIHERGGSAALKLVHADAISVGGVVSLTSKRYSEESLSGEERAANVQIGLRPDASETRLTVGIPLAFGRLDQENFLQRGALLNLSCEHAFALTTKTDQRAAFVDAASWDLCVATALAFLITPLRGNLGARLTLGGTTSSQFPNLFFLGGFDSVRGLADGQLRGTHMWNVNFEFRVPSYVSRHFVLQHAAFLDAGDAADSWGHLRKPVPWSTPPTTAGVGVRLIAPQIFGLALRIDYAWLLTPGQGGGFSAALGQFF